MIIDTKHHPILGFGLALGLVFAGPLGCDSDEDQDDMAGDSDTGDEAEDDGDEAEDVGEDAETSEDGEDTETTGENGPFEGPSAMDDPICDEMFSLCGDILIPSTFEGETRSLAVALYTTIPPAGPPDAILAEIDAPELSPNQRYPLVITPFLQTGEYYIWLNLYMEGGGTFVPLEGIDYTGATPEPMTFDNSPAYFGEILLELAEGF